MTVRTALARPVPAAAATTALLLPVIVAMILIWTSGPSPQPVDIGWFGPGGTDLLTGRWGSIYGEPAVQAGPFELLPFGAAQLLGVSGTAAWTIVLTAFAAATAFLTAIVLRPTLSADLRSSVLAAGGTLIVATAGPIMSWTLGHPSEALVPLVWAVAGRLALRDRPALAAALVAASSGFEVWGVLGAPVVLLAPHLRLLRPAIAGAVVLGALWAPFVVAGPFSMFAFSWPVVQRSLLHALQPETTTFPWTFRLAQAVLAVGAGSVVALLLRRRAAAWGPWAVIVAVVTARLILDPVLAGYYWDPALIAAVGALVLAAHRADLVAAVVTAVALVLTADIGAPVPRAAVLTAFTLLAAAAAGWRAGRATTAPPPSRRSVVPARP